jgi:hypothetical protein
MVDCSTRAYIFDNPTQFANGSYGPYGNLSPVVENLDYDGDCPILQSLLNQYQHQELTMMDPAAGIENYKKPWSYNPPSWQTNVLTVTANGSWNRSILEVFKSEDNAWICGLPASSPCNPPKLQPWTPRMGSRSN